MNHLIHTSNWKSTGSDQTRVASPPQNLFFNIDFESPNYTVGTSSFDAATNSGSLAGSAPNMFTKITNGDNSSQAWTATVAQKVADNPAAGNWLVLSVPDGSAFQGVIEAFSPPGESSQTGTWFMQFEFTQLSSQTGGYLGNFGLISQDGNGMANQGIYLDTVEPGVNEAALTQGTTYVVRLEVDMGSTAPGSARTYLDGSLIRTFEASYNQGEVGGLVYSFTSGGGYVGDMQFALDNIQAGMVPASIPEPATAALLTGGGILAALGFRRVRR